MVAPAPWGWQLRSWGDSFASSQHPEIARSKRCRRGMGDQLVNGWLMMKIPCEWLARLNPTDDENLRFYGFSLALGVFGVWFGAWFVPCQEVFGSIKKCWWRLAARTLEQFPLQGLSKLTSYESYLVQVHFEVAVGKMLEITSILTPYSRNWRMGKIWKNTVNQQLPWFGVLGFSCWHTHKLGHQFVTTPITKVMFLMGERTC